MSNLKLVLDNNSKKEVRINGYQLNGNKKVIFIKPESLYQILQEDDITNMEKAVYDYYKICVKAEWNEFHPDDRILFPYTDDEIKICIDYITISDKVFIKSTLEKMGFNNDEYKNYLMFAYNKYNKGESLSTDDIKSLTSLIALVICREYGFKFKYDLGIQTYIPIDIEHLKENINHYFGKTILEKVSIIEVDVVEWSQEDFDIDPYKSNDIDVELIAEYYFNTLILKLKSIRKNIELKEKIKIKLEQNYQKWLALPVSTEDEIKRKLYIAVVMYCDSLLHAECLYDYEPAHKDFAKECAKILNIEFDDNELYGPDLSDVHSELFNSIAFDLDIKISDSDLDENGLRIMDIFYKEFN